MQNCKELAERYAAMIRDNAVRLSLLTWASGVGMRLMGVGR